MKKDKKPDTLTVINNYNFCDIQTDGHGNSMTNPAQGAKSVKTQIGSLPTGKPMKLVQ